MALELRGGKTLEDVNMRLSLSISAETPKADTNKLVTGNCRALEKWHSHSCSPQPEKADEWTGQVPFGLLRFTSLPTSHVTCRSGGGPTPSWRA